MSLIHMETEALSHLAERMRAAIDDFFDTYQTINKKVNQLSRDWYGGSADRFISKTNRNLWSLTRQIDRLDAFRLRLLKEVDQWVAVDRNFGVDLKRSLRGVGGAYRKPEHYDDEMERIIRHLDIDEKNSLLRGWKKTWELKGFSSPEAEAAYYRFEKEIKNGSFDLTYEETLELYALWEQGKLPKDWPNPKMPKVDFAAKIYERDFGTAQLAALSGQVGSENLGYDYSVVSLEATGSASIEYGEGAFTGGVSGQAGFYVGKISGNASADIPLGPATLGLAAAGTAYVGAQVAGEAKLAFDPKKGEFGVKAGGEAFAGGKAEGEVEVGVGAAGVEGKVKASGSVNYGIGAKAEIDVGYDQGTIRAEIELGATLGLGVDFGVDVELDVSEAVDNILDAGQDAVAFLF